MGNAVPSGAIIVRGRPGPSGEPDPSTRRLGRERCGVSRPKQRLSVGDVLRTGCQTERDVTMSHIWDGCLDSVRGNAPSR